MTNTSLSAKYMSALSILENYVIESISPNQQCVSLSVVDPQSNKKQQLIFYVHDEQIAWYVTEAESTAQAVQVMQHDMADIWFKELVVFITRIHLAYTIDQEPASILITLSDNNIVKLCHYYDIYELIPIKNDNGMKSYIVNTEKLGIIANYTLYDYIIQYMSDMDIALYFKHKPVYCFGLKQLLLVYIENRIEYLGGNLQKLIQSFEDRINDSDIQSNLGITLCNTYCKSYPNKTECLSKEIYHTLQGVIL